MSVTTSPPPDGQQPQPNGCMPDRPVVVEVSKDFERAFLNTAGGFNAPIRIKRVHPQSHQEETIVTSPAQLIEALCGYIFQLATLLATLNQNVVVISQKQEELLNGLGAVHDGLQVLAEVIERNSAVGEQIIEQSNDEEDEQPIFEPQQPRQRRQRKRA